MKKLLLILLCLPLLFSSCNNDKELQNDAIGKNVFDYRYENNLGNPETLKGTNNTYWITYYPQADITLLARKKNDKILNAVSGRKPNLKQ